MLYHSHQRQDDPTFGPHGEMCARSWENAGRVFHPVSPRILMTHVNGTWGAPPPLSSKRMHQQNPKRLPLRQQLRLKLSMHCFKPLSPMPQRRTESSYSGTSTPVLEKTLSSGAVSSAISGPGNRIPMASNYLTSVPPMACSF